LHATFFSSQDDAVENKAGAILPSDCISNLASSNWKERLAAMETFTQVALFKNLIPVIKRRNNL
jgi:hypothetical protein